MRLAATAVFLIEEYRTCKEPSGKYVVHLLLDSLCRHAPWRRFYASKRAQKKADQLGLGDLAQYHWRHQKKAMGDKERKVFHWEHVHTVRQLRTELLKLPSPDDASVRRVLRKATGAWILKSEDKKLSDNGYTSKRPFPFAAYRKVGIELIRRRAVPV